MLKANLSVLLPRLAFPVLLKWVLLLLMISLCVAVMAAVATGQTGPTPVIQVLALYESTCSIQAPPTSDLRCWGQNDFGQLGQGDTTDRGDAKWEMGVNLSAVDLGTGLAPRPNITTASLAHHSCLVLDPDGSVKCFGRGNSGQLGYGDTDNRGDSPGGLGDALPVVDLGSSLPPVLRLVQAGLHNCVLFAKDLRIKCWGWNIYGQLGYEDQDDRGDDPSEMGDSLPVVDFGAGLRAIESFTGFYHTCVHLNDTRQGGLKCWGHNVYGQLGYGDTNNRGDDAGEMGDALPLVNLSPSGHVHVTQGDAGQGHTCILLNDSVVKCFGRGDDGELGYGDIDRRGDDPGEMGDSLLAVDVLGSATGVHVIRVQCGGWHSCALISDGSMKCWGDGDFGRLGLENTDDIGDGAGEMGDSLPVISLGGPGVVSASLGRWHTCVRLNDSSAKCFGYNEYGQLGQGDMSHRGDDAGEMGSSLPVVDVGPVVTQAPPTAPTTAPTRSPSPAPTPALAPTPTIAPTLTPSAAHPSAMPNSTTHPTLTPTASPTTAPTLAPTVSIATVLAENEIPLVQATVQGGGTVHVRWPAQSDPRMTVVGYRVAMQSANAGSFATVSEPSQNWTMVTGLTPRTRYGFKVAVVATRGVGSLSEETAQVTTWNDSVGFFEDTGVALRVIASVPLPRCDASAILDVSENVGMLFGSPHPACTLINQRTARLALVNGATLAPGTVVRVWTNETFAFSAPSNPTPITTSLSSASHVAWCDSWTADASSSTGVGGGAYPLSYRWWVSSLDASNAAAVSEENMRLSSLSSTTNRVLFNATRFVHNSVVAVHVTVSSPAFNLSATTQADTNISALDQPTVSIVGSSNRSVLSFQDLAIRTAVSAPDCFSGSANSSVFSWVAVQGVMPAAATTMTRTLVIPALSLDVTQTYIFRVRMTLGDFPFLPAVTADVQVSTLLTPPVVALAGGTQRTVGCEANTTLDASSSYDPNVCGALQQCPVLIFTWTCVGCTDTSFDDVQNDAALLQFRACDMVNRTTAFPEENATAMLQLDVAVYSTVSQLIASSGVETTVLAPEVPAPPVIVLDPIPGTVTPNDSITVCSGSNGTLDIADTETQTSSLQAVGSYFTLSTAVLQSGVQYQLALQDSATGVVAATSVALNDPPSLGTFIVSPNTVAGGEAVLDMFELRSWGHIDDPAHMPLSMTFSWQDGSGYEAVLLQNTVEFSLADVALPAGSSVSARVQVVDRLGSFASLAETLAGELVVSVSSLPSAVDWSRPGAITSALQSWSAFSADLLPTLLNSEEQLSFDDLALMVDLSPSNFQAQRMVDLVPAAFAAIPADELTQGTCAAAQRVATLPGVNAINALVFLAQIADSGCGSSVFFAASMDSQPYVSLANVSNVRFGLAEDTDVSTSSGVTLQVPAAITSALASNAEFVDTRISTISQSETFDTANMRVLSPVHNVELRPSTLPCSDLCNDWEGQANGTCTAQDLSANTSNLGADAVTITVNVDLDAVRLDDKEFGVGYEIACGHAQLDDFTWSREGCELVERTESTVTCKCSHLTSFGVLAYLGDANDDEAEKDVRKNIGVVVALGALWVVFLASLLSGRPLDQKEDHEQVKELRRVRAMSNNAADDANVRQDWRGAQHAVKMRVMRSSSATAAESDLHSSWKGLVWNAVKEEHSLLSVAFFGMRSKLAGLRFSYRITALFCEFLTVLFVAVLLYEEQLVYDKAKEGILNARNSRKTTELVLEIVVESFISVAVWIPLHTLLHHGFKRICHARVSAAYFAETIFLQREVVLSSNTGAMSVPELVSLNSRLDALHKLCKAELSMLEHRNQTTEEELAAFQQEIMNRVRQKRRETASVLRQARQEAHEECEKALRDANTGWLLAKRARRKWRLKMEREERHQHQLDCMSAFERQEYLTDQLLVQELQSQGLRGWLRARLYSVFVKDTSWRAQHSAHKSTKVTVLSLVVLWMLFCSLFVLVFALRMGSAAVQHSLANLAFALVINFLVISPVVIVCGRVIVPAAVAHVVQQEWQNASDEVNRFVVLQLDEFGSLDHGALASSLSAKGLTKRTQTASSDGSGAGGGGGAPGLCRSAQTAGVGEANYSALHAAVRLRASSRTSEGGSVLSDQQQPQQAGLTTLQVGPHGETIIFGQDYLLKRPVEQPPLHVALVRDADLAHRFLGAVQRLLFVRASRRDVDDDDDDSGADEADGGDGGGNLPASGMNAHSPISVGSDDARVHSVSTRGILGAAAASSYAAAHSRRALQDVLFGDVELVGVPLFHAQQRGSGKDDGGGGQSEISVNMSGSRANAAGSPAPRISSVDANRKQEETEEQEEEPKSPRQRRLQQREQVRERVRRGNIETPSWPAGGMEQSAEQRWQQHQQQREEQERQRQPITGAENPMRSMQSAASASGYVSGSANGRSSGDVTSPVLPV